MTQYIGRISDREARALSREKQRCDQRNAQADAGHYYGLIVQRISESAREGKFELHYPFVKIPDASRLHVIRCLQEDGFQVHDDSIGGVVRWSRYGAD